MSQAWSTSPFSCFSDCGICIGGCTDPASMHKWTLNKLMEEKTGKVAWKNFSSHGLFFCLLPCCAALSAHNKLAEHYGLEGPGCMECLISWFCVCLLVCQHAREIQIRESANMANRGGAVTHAPEQVAMNKVRPA